MRFHQSLSSLIALVVFAIASLSYADDTPPAAKSDTPNDQGHMMMDHSPADTKAMSRMKDKHVKVHHDGDEPSASSDGTTEHVMMDHSSGDQKSMSRMKGKPHVHHLGDASTSSSDSNAGEHMMMDHSPADTKAMSRMKNKTIPVHKSAPSNPSDTDEHQTHHASSSLSK